MLEEVFGVEHVELVPRRKGVGEKLVGTQRRAVLGIKKAILTGRNRNDFLVFDLIDDVDEKPRVPAGSEDLGLWPFFAIGRDDVLARQGRCPVDLVEHRYLVRLDMDIRGRCQTGQRDHEKNDAQRQRKRAKVRSRSIDEEAEKRGSDRCKDEVQNRYDDPKHRSLQAAAKPGRVSSERVRQRRARKPPPRPGCRRAGAGSEPCCRSSRSYRAAVAYLRRRASPRASRARSTGGP